MKKFLVLSFLMVVFAATVSFAQTRSVVHYKSNPAAPFYITNYEITNPLPSDPTYHYGGFSISSWSPGDINYTNVNIYIKYLDGGDYNRFRTVYGADGAFEDYHFDPALVEYVFWSFEVSFTNGDVEYYDITDTYI